MSIKIEPVIYPYLFVIGIVFIAAVIVIAVLAKADKKKSDYKTTHLRKLQETGIKYQGRFFLIYGLNIPENTGCMMSSCADGIFIEAHGVRYVLKREQIIDICTRTNTEMQKQHVSGAGTGVFGPVGAVISERVREEASQGIENYLIITYDKEGTPDYIAFSITGQMEMGKRFSDEYKNLNVMCEAES